MPYLIKFQIGPVQDFIAAARSTRDLWSGSYLLSWLVAAGIKALPRKGDELIFPAREGQPLLEPLDLNHKDVLIPNLPNIFIAEVVGEASAVAQAVAKAIDDEWKKIAESVWAQATALGIPTNKKTAFDTSVNRHLSISWQATPMKGDYAEAYRNNGWHLDAVRQSRDFAAWGGGEWKTGAEKDSLTGKEEAVCGGRTQDGKDFSSRVSERFKHLFKHNDHLGAISLIKRVWHLTYLKDKQKLPTASHEFNIRSIPAIAARTAEHDDARSTDESSGGDKYIAAIAFDGDSIGAWVNGDKSPADTDLRKHHADFSGSLSDFALGKVRAIVEGTADDQRAGKWKGQLIYAGGDDVVCLVPADAALEVAAALRKAFRDCTDDTPSTESKPDASAGIAIGHIHAPLQDLIREAQEAEKRAKNIVGRPAFSITLMKRSGEISHWGGKWDSGAAALIEEIANRLHHGQLSAKFPHRVCALLEPYLVSQSRLMEQRATMTDAAGFDATEIIRREFAFAIFRQSASGQAKDNEAALQPLLDAYLRHLPEEPQTRITSLIGLCTTVAFAHRTKPENTSTADKQALATT